MASYTPNYNLKKPAQTDFYDIDDHNGNMDILDAELAKRSEKPATFTAGNFPKFDAKGNLLDSGAATATLPTKAEVAAKVDKIPGKGLSTEDYTTTEKAKLAGLSNYDDTAVRGLIRGKADGNPATGAALNAEKLFGTNKIATLDGTGFLDIPAGSDLNDATYRAFGSYRCGTNDTAITLKNTPFSEAFVLWVIPGNGRSTTYPAQIARSYLTGEVKQRTYRGDSVIWGSGWVASAQTTTGFFTPEVLGFVNGSRYTCSYTERGGRYTKVGKLVVARANATIQTVNESAPWDAALLIDGMPFPVVNWYGTFSCLALGLTAAGEGQPPGTGLFSAAYVAGQGWYMRQWNDASFFDVPYKRLRSGTILGANFVYETA